MSKIDEKALVTRQMALSMGFSRYFTGEKCPQGHISERHTSDKKCIACKKEKLLSKYKTEQKYKDRRAKVIKTYIAKNPQKKSAQLQVQNSIRDGRLLRMPCTLCGNPKSEGHHEDYSKPLDVIWLCRKHHRERHKEMENAK